MFMTLGWWGMVPLVGLTALMGWALGGWGSGQALVTNLLATAGLAALMAVFVNAIGAAERAAARRAGRAGRDPGGTGRGVPAGRGAGRARAARPGAARHRRAGFHQRGDAARVGRAGPRRRSIRTRRAPGSGCATARETARDSLDELRATVRALRPDLLASASLPQALAERSQRWSADVGSARAGAGDRRADGTAPGHRTGAAADSTGGAGQHPPARAAPPGSWSPCPTWTTW